MMIYILMDDDPNGGYFAGQDWLPNMEWERASIREVRAVDMPEETWEFIINGGAPLDTMRDQTTSHDSTWLPWWLDGRVVWSRS